MVFEMALFAFWIFFLGNMIMGKKLVSGISFNDPENKNLWTIKHQYDEDILVDSKCRDISMVALLRWTVMNMK